MSSSKTCIALLFVNGWFLNLNQEDGQNPPLATEINIDKRETVFFTNITHSVHDCLLDSLVSLSLANLWFHVTLSQDVREGSADDGSVELLRTSRPPLSLLLLLSLLVLAPVRQIERKIKSSHTLSNENKKKTSRRTIESSQQIYLYRTVHVTFLGLRFIK